MNAVQCEGQEISRILPLIIKKARHGMVVSARENSTLRLGGRLGMRANYHYRVKIEQIRHRLSGWMAPFSYPLN